MKTHVCSLKPAICLNKESHFMPAELIKKTTTSHFTPDSFVLNLLQKYRLTQEYNKLHFRSTIVRVATKTFSIMYRSCREVQLYWHFNQYGLEEKISIHALYEDLMFTMFNKLLFWPMAMWLHVFHSKHAVPLFHLVYSPMQSLFGQWPLMLTYSE